MKKGKRCFVISRIGQENSEIRKQADKVLKFIIKPALEEIGYEVKRADEVTEAGSISKSIIQDILTSDLVIADLTGSNPNVFYELAIRHATAKPFIQIIEKTEKIPFDIYDIRTIMYELDLEGVEKAKNGIQEFAKSVEKEQIVSTPISEVSSLLKISLNNSEESSSETLINELQRINENITNLEHKLAGRIEQMLAGNSNANMNMEEKLGMVFLEKMLDNPNKSDDMIKMIGKLSQLGNQ